MAVAKWGNTRLSWPIIIGRNRRYTPSASGSMSTYPTAAAASANVAVGRASASPTCPRARRPRACGYAKRRSVSRPVASPAPACCQCAASTTRPCCFIAVARRSSAVASSSWRGSTPRSPGKLTYSLWQCSSASGNRISKATTLASASGPARRCAYLSRCHD